jgi:hypothetical protein
VKRVLIAAVVVMGVSWSSALGRKHSAAYKVAKQRCNQDYKMQMESAKRHTHSEREKLVAGVKKAHRDCLAHLPR